jgi:hypothetical protein
MRGDLRGKIGPHARLPTLEDAREAFDELGVEREGLGGE